MSKWVYCFGDGKAEGKAEMKNLLGGKGANLAEMSQHRPARAARLHHHHRGLHRLLRQRPEATRPSSRTQVARRAGHDREGDRRQVRRPDEPAAGLRPLRRPRLDARHDGHRPQPRPQRHDGRGPGRRRPATRASPTTATAASSRCSATSCSASTTTTSRTILEHVKHDRGVKLDTDLDRRRTAGAGRRLQGGRTRSTTGKPFPQDPHEQLWARDRRRVQLLDERPRRSTTAG